MTKDWNYFPPLIVPASVLALAIGRGGLWASGPGGAVWRAPDGEWHSRISGLPLTDVAALVYAGGWLIAGGAEGIARSKDGGIAWEAAAGDVAAVAAIAVSPAFTTDGTALAAMLGDGITRTQDAGRTWQAATAGLHNFDVSALAWAEAETVLAATAAGVCRSLDAGQTWQLATETESRVIAALAFLPDGTALAACEVGGILRSEDHGQHWAAGHDLPDGAMPTALHVTPEGVLPTCCWQAARFGYVHCNA